VLKSLGAHVQEENMNNPFMSRVPRLRPGFKSLIEVDNHSYIVFVGCEASAAADEVPRKDVQSEGQPLMGTGVTEESTETSSKAIPMQASECSPKRCLPASSSAAASVLCQVQASSSSSAAPFVVKLAPAAAQPTSAAAPNIGSDVSRNGSSAPNKVRKRWTNEEEDRLIEGQGQYGHKWEQIRMNCELQKFAGTQIRDKWVNLLKSDRVRSQPY